MVVVRADASDSMGMGHVARCLTLAEGLRARGARVVFVCGGLRGNAVDTITGRGFGVRLIPVEGDGPETHPERDAIRTMDAIRTLGGRVDWLVVDHYGIDARWESVVRGSVRRILVIDDLADRRHDCDALLDQTPQWSPVDRYRGLVPNDCTLFLGLGYLLLGEGFIRARLKQGKGPGGLEYILVSYGGADPTNETEKCVIGLEDLVFRFREVGVVMGQANPRADRIAGMCAERGMTVYTGVNRLEGLMAWADLAFGAGGITMWERCCLGLPSVVTIVAENQRESVGMAAEVGAVRSLGWHGGVTPDSIRDAVVRFDDEPGLLAGMRAAALDLVDDGCLHGVERLCGFMLDGYGGYRYDEA